MFTTTQFKKALIYFWFIWWAIALWTDIAGGLAHLGYLTASFAPDINYPPLVASLTMYHVPSIVPFILYIAIIFGSLLSTTLFGYSVIALCQPQPIWLARARSAFIFSLLFWCAFFLADQLTLKFDFEENHMVQGGFEFLCFFAMYLLPDEGSV